MEKAKNKKVRIIVWIVVALVLIYLIALLTGNTKSADEGNDGISAPSSQTVASGSSDDVYSVSVAEPDPEPVKAPYKTELSSGNYTSGIDFPEGTYTITAISGSGNVSSDNMFSGGLNAIMSPESDDMYESQYKNIELTEGTTLTISGVEIKLVPSK